ncbi:MAG TPA: hypothetical protein ENI23_17760 [bacterium]|nr:hypothetical protein [bacterium]
MTTIEKAREGWETLKKDGHNAFTLSITINMVKDNYEKAYQELQESIEIKVREDRKRIIEIIIAHDKRYRVFGSGNDYFLKKLLKAIEVKK